MLSGSLCFAQDWQYIGGEGALGSTSEVDIAVGSNGTLYALYIDGTRGSVKKWSGSTWTLVGSTQFTHNNISDVQIALVENDYPVVAYKHQSGSSIGVKYFNGTSWVSFGSNGGDYSTSVGKEFSLVTSENDGVYLTYYDVDGTFGSGNTLKTVSLNLATGLQYGDDIANDANDTYYDSHVGSFIDGNEDSWITYDENDVGSGGTYLKKKNGASYTSYTVLSGSQTNGIDCIDLGTSVGVVYTPSGDNYYYTNLNKSSGFFGSSPWIGSYTDVDITNNGTDLFLFGRRGGAHVVRQYNNSTALVTNWSDIGPSANVSSPSITHNGDFPVIAMVEGGQASVMELNVAATVDYTAENFCVGTSITSDDITVSDPNYDNSNATVSVTGGGPLSNGSISGTYPNYNASFDVDMSSSSNGLYSIDFIYDGQSHSANLALFSNPEIVFDFPTNEICTNGNAIDLNDHVSPSGGEWELIGEEVVDGGILDPSDETPGNYNLSYTFTNPITGCEGTDIFNFDLYASPSVSITSTPSSCGEDDGTATATITISTGDSYSVYWSNGDITEMADSLNPGMYFVNVRTINGCVAMAPASIENTDLTLSANITPATCFGEASGLIDLTINGTGADYSIHWSNGSTDEDLSDLLSGPYVVTVEDENGCVASQPFFVSQPNQITWTAGSNVSTCTGGDGLAYCQVTGGSSPYDFQWFNSDGTSIGTNNDTLDNISGGFYQVIITDAAGCSANWNTTVNETGGPTVTIDSVYNASCSDDGSIFTTIDAPSGIQEIGWNSGETTEDITGLAPGYYAIWVIDNSGCTGMASYELEAILPEPLDICLVSVDTNTTTNKVVWEKPVSSTIASFNVYRETSQAGLFQLVDEVLYSEESEFTDPVASPQVRSWRYKISSVDLCGRESELSEDHKTIHLTISQGLGSNVNLHWDQYIGINYSTYNIWRHDAIDGWGTGPLVALPLSSTSYTDIPATDDELDYMVVIDLPGTCSSSKANDYNSSRSNRSQGVFSPDDISVDELESSIIELYPNPSNGQFKLVLDGIGMKQVKIISSNGKMIYQNQTTSNEVNFNLSNIEAGMYHLIIQSDKQNIMKKIMIR